MGLHLHGHELSNRNQVPVDEAGQLLENLCDGPLVPEGQLLVGWLVLDDPMRIVDKDVQSHVLDGYLDQEVGINQPGLLDDLHLIILVVDRYVFLGQDVLDPDNRIAGQLAVAVILGTEL